MAHPEEKRMAHQSVPTPPNSQFYNGLNSQPYHYYSGSTITPNFTISTAGPGTFSSPPLLLSDAFRHLMDFDPDPSEEELVAIDQFKLDLLLLWDQLA